MKKSSGKNKQKTVLFVIDEYVYGGITTLVQQYSKVLADEGWRVLVLGDQANIDIAIFFDPRVEVYISSTQHRYSYVAQVKQTLKMLRVLAKIVESNHIDFIHMHLPWSSLAVLLHPKLKKVKKVCTFSGAYDLEASYDVNKVPFTLHTAFYLLKLTLGGFFKKAFHYWAMSKVNVLTTYSEYSKGLLRSHFNLPLPNQKFILLPGLVDESTFVNSSPKTSHKELHIINFGRFEPRKGIDLLLKACALLKQKRIAFTAAIAAPFEAYSLTNYFEEYERLNLFRSVHFLHKVNTSQKRSLLERADLFVMPSRALETFGMTVLEAWAAGVVVVSTPAGALYELVKKVHSKLVATDISAEALAESIAWYAKLSVGKKNELKRKALNVAREYSIKNKKNKKLILSLYA